MFEPPLINQLLGTGAVILGFIGAGILARQMELHELEKQRKLEEREEIRQNIRREFQGFTYDNEPPVGLRPETLALPEPRRARYAKYLG